MSRGRLLPSLNYRSKAYVDMSLPNHNLRGMDLIEVYGASNVNDAFNNPVKMFDVRYDYTYRSPYVLASRIKVDESHRDQTRFIFNLDDFATANNGIGARIPTDDEVCFIRIRGRIKATGQFTDYGPLVVLIPYDFFSTSAPVFTTIANAPDMGANIPDSLDSGGLNLHLPSFSHTVNIENISAVAGEDLYFSCSPGMTPSLLKPGTSISLTSSSVGEFFFGGNNSTPQFTIRCSVINRG